MRLVPPPFHLAQKVGARLGACALLLGRVPTTRASRAIRAGRRRSAQSRVQSIVRRELEPSLRPAHVVARHEPSWLGHRPLVAAKHYLQTRDAHFEVAIRGMPRVGEAEAHTAPIRATA